MVRVHYTPGAVELAVTDTGRGRRNGDGAGGHGLVGMRQRVGMYGGDLRAAPGPDGGYEVRVRLPLRPSGS